MCQQIFKKTVPQYNSNFLHDKNLKKTNTPLRVVKTREIAQLTAIFQKPFSVTSKLEQKSALSHFQSYEN